MLSVERTKELLSSLNLTDNEAEHIRDIAFMFADLAYEAWTSDEERTKRAKLRQPKYRTETEGP